MDEVWKHTATYKKNMETALATQRGSIRAAVVHHVRGHASDRKCGEGLGGASSAASAPPPGFWTRVHIPSSRVLAAERCLPEGVSSPVHHACSGRLRPNRNLTNFLAVAAPELLVCGCAFFPSSSSPPLLALILFASGWLRGNTDPGCERAIHHGLAVLWKTGWPGWSAPDRGGKGLAFCWTRQACTWHAGFGENPELISRTGVLATGMRNHAAFRHLCKQDLCCRGRRMVASQKR